MPEGSKEREVLFEFYQIGNSVKVSAIDPATGVEAVIVGPSSAPREHLKRSAIRKLDYVLAKRAKGG